MVLGSSDPKNISWGAFNFSALEKKQQYQSIRALLPLFHEKAASAAMIKHGMQLVTKLTDLLNTKQVPVLCADQPLFTLGKLIQWNCPAQFGEDKFVMLLGSFHIEQNFLKIVGKILKGNGWIGVIASSGIIAKGSAEAILKVNIIFFFSGGINNFFF